MVAMVDPAGAACDIDPAGVAALRALGWSVADTPPAAPAAPATPAPPMPQGPGSKTVRGRRKQR